MTGNACSPWVACAHGLVFPAGCDSVASVQLRPNELLERAVLHQPLDVPVARVLPRGPGTRDASGPGASGSPSGGSGSASPTCSAAAARRIGHSARDLDPEQRRDGIGLLLLAVALVAAASQWWSLDGPVDVFCRRGRLGSAGRLAWAVPLLLVGLSWWVLRHPAGHAPTGRLVIGWAATVGGALGIAHALAGTPQPVEGASAMRSGRGVRRLPGRGAPGLRA